MQVNWITRLPIDSYVFYRPLLCTLNPVSSDWKKSKASQNKYIYGSVSDFQHSFMYAAVMDSLNSDCFYEYYVGNDWAMSDKFVFSGRTPNNPSDINQSIRLLLFGNWGYNGNADPNTYLMTRHSQVRDFDGVFHLGNIAYSLDKSNGIIGDKFLNMIQPIASSFPYMTLPGYLEKLDNFTHYQHRFKMPGFYYSLSLGLAHILVIDAEIYFDEVNSSKINSQLEFINQDLKTANEKRNKEPWIVVLMTRPMYCDMDTSQSAQTICKNQAETLRNGLEDLFYDYSVDLVVSAHLNVYERLAPLYRSEIRLGDNSTFNTYKDPKAPTYVISGMSGNEKGKEILNLESLSESSKFISNELGYGRLIITNKTHLYWEQFSSDTMSQIDHTWIIKSNLTYNN